MHCGHSIGNCGATPRLESTMAVGQAAPITFVPLTRSSPPTSTSAAAKFRGLGSAKMPAAPRSVFPKLKPSRLRVVLGGVRSLMPLHSVTASAFLNSLLSSTATCSSLSEAFATLLYWNARPSISLMEHKKIGMLMAPQGAAHEDTASPAIWDLNLGHQITCNTVNSDDVNPSRHHFTNFSFRLAFPCHILLLALSVARFSLF